MQIINSENPNNGSFLLHKFNSDNTDNSKNNPDAQNIDKTKILELSNFIDTWEQEILFADNGFYSLKGKNVQGKSKEFISELEDLINSKIDEISFSHPIFRTVAFKVKKDKLASILQKMQVYENQQLYNWQMEVFDNALKSAINRAVLYKNNEDIIAASFKNGLSIIELLAEKEQWQAKTVHAKLCDFKSQFFYSIILSFLDDRDINASIYYKKYKKFLINIDTEKLETALQKLEFEIIAYNWAKEVFSYNLSEDEQLKKLNDIDNENVKTLAKHFLKDFSALDKQEKDKQEKEKNLKNWQQILEIAKTDVNRAELYIDYTLKENHIKAANDYLKQIKKFGFIKTDTDEFFNLLSEFMDDFNAFKKKDLSFFRACLSESDYQFFEKLICVDEKEYILIYSDFKYLQDKLKNNRKLSQEEKYNFAKLTIYVYEFLKSDKNKSPNIVERTKFLDAICSYFVDLKKEGENK